MEKIFTKIFFMLGVATNGLTYFLLRSCPDAFHKKGVLKSFAKFKENHMCWSLFFIKVAGWKAATLLKRDTGMVSLLPVFSCQFCEILKNHYFLQHLRLLLLFNLPPIMPTVYKMLIHSKIFQQVLHYGCLVYHNFVDTRLLRVQLLAIINSFMFLYNPLVLFFYDIKCNTKMFLHLSRFQ